ncbi:hypothetical protein BCR39DRAFT_560142 [Naematelia encephala]|uniref:Pal1 cell morphology protein-domain-containing protein n=1 Tax=Naematelia encephala TaxID=71784 RepID=A0A1Y2AX92_9TREE|nr:hypothetical protein BCR39DRAFT_560142 [Naematelia encephala]
MQRPALMNALRFNPDPPPHLPLPNDLSSRPSRRPYRSNTTTTSSSANLLAPASPERSKMRTRRSLSSDSYGLDAGQKEVAAGQRKTAEDKKASRHADVIDTWDPTGLGSAMWHHSGPYDAAAPSRNTNLPPSKAPMRAFNGAPVQSPPRGPTTISLSSPPVPPSKDLPEGNGHKRAQSAMRAQATRRQSGGLTGQYSTSMPASGGYFPDPDEGTDDASTARRDRQKQRDDKRRALKAAWGTDIPEPFEDFGGSPLGDEMDLTDDMYSPESQTAQLPGRPMRSPGLRMGLGARTPSIKEESSSPTGDFPPQTTYSRGVAQPLPGGGVKRTKSLMQKFKTMVRTRSGSVESQPAVPSVYGRSADRSHSISAGGQRPAISPGIGRPEGQAVVEEELMDEMDDDNQFADAREDVFGTATEMGQWQGSRGERRAMSEGRRR